MRTLQFLKHDGGLFEEVTARVVPTNFTPSAKNVDLDLDGELVLPRNGYTRHFETPITSAKVDGIWPYRKSDGTFYLMAATGDGVLWIIYPDGVAHGLATLEAGNSPWFGLAYGGKFFFANGRNPIQVVGEPEIVLGIPYFTTDELQDIDGVSVPGEWGPGNYPAKIGLVMQGKNERLFAFGMPEDHSRVYFSALQNWLDWTTDNDAFSLAPLEETGERIMAVASFYEKLIIFKETQAVIYTGLDPTSGDVNAPTSVIPYGCVSNRSIVRVENDLLWMSQEGPMSLRAVEQYGDLAADTLGGRIRVTLKEMNALALESIVGVNDVKNRRVRWCYPVRGLAGNSKILDYYYDRRVKDSSGRISGAFMYGDNIPATCFCTYESAGGHVVLFGDEDGYVNRLNFMWTDNGTLIESEYNYAEVDPGVRCRLVEADFMVSEGGGRLSASIVWDEQDEIPMVGSLEPASHLVHPAQARKVPLGNGRTFHVKVIHDGTDNRSTLVGWRGRVSLKGRR